MDNFSSSGNNMADETFGFVPPNLMYPENAYKANGFSSKEEMERYFYHMEHDNELHVKDDPSNDIF